MVPGLAYGLSENASPNSATGNNTNSNKNGNLKEPEPAKSLPAEWYRSEQIFELQRRALFEKGWILATHTLRFDKPGDYISADFAGFPYVIVWHKDGSYRAFHNSCRHRAFPVVQKPKGNASMFACMYHSWSYRQDGSLIKAPRMDGVPGFKKEENGLFPIHVHVTNKGFIFINFSAGEPEPFEKYFGDLPQEWSHLPSEEYEYCFSWEIEGNYNWQTFMDGYQECYHCQVGHPGFAKVLDLPQYNVIPFQNFARHVAPLKNKVQQEQIAASQPPTFTFVFPAQGCTTSQQMFYIMRTCPISPTKTRMNYDVFKRKGIPTDEFRDWFKFYEQVEKEDYDLCVGAQRALNAGIYSKGILQPDNERGVLYYHGKVLEKTLDHFNQEQKAGHEIHAARPASQTHGDECAATKVCNALKKEEMAW